MMLQLEFCNAELVKKTGSSLSYTAPPHLGWREWLVYITDGRNQIAIRFNRDLNRNEDLIQTLRDSIQVPCDFILIRFKF